MGALTVVGLALALSLFIARSAEGTGICGERKLTADALIANGYTARSGAWPWHGAMFHRYRLGIVGYVCGVTILTEQFVLTAAHCTYERGSQSLPANRLFVKVGFSNLDSPEDRVRQFDVDKIARHEEYDMDSFENDIALLKLSCEIIFTNYIQPAAGTALMSAMETVEVDCICGWVRTGFYVDLEVVALLIPTSDCNLALGPLQVVPPASVDIIVVVMAFVRNRMTTTSRDVFRLLHAATLLVPTNLAN
ncbi:hypothetical protein RP20_CCG009420 [Aedes albopictus]|nr:hypothetical protein RP20_CCG009420 [Aedes albopictus]